MVFIAATSEEEMVSLMRRALATLLPELVFTNDKKDELEDDLLTIDQAAKFLHVTRQTITNWRRQGEITCVTKGGRVYFSKSDLLKSFKTKKKAKGNV